jgi:hypothetical protein
MPKWIEGWLISKLLLKVRVAKLGAELSIYTGRIDAVESRMTDLAERFQRFQNRQNMRTAREAMEVDGNLADEAASILALPATADPPVSRGLANEKLALWKKRGLS